MRVEEVIRYNQIVKDIFEHTSIDGTLKFRFLQMAKQFAPVVENFDQVKQEILQKYSETKPDGRSGIFMPVREDYDSDEAYNVAVTDYQDKIKKFEADLTPVLNEDVTIELKKFKSNEIMNSGIPLEALLILYDFIEE